MNCLDFRRRIAARPERLDETLTRHVRECTACARFETELHELDEDIRRVLDVPVPEQLAPRILLAQSTRCRRRQSRLWWLASAASLLLLVGLIVAIVNQRADEPLEDVVVAHIRAEAHHLTERNDVPVEKLQNVLARVGQRVVGDIGAINYAGVCPIGARNGAHLIIEGQRGPVTVLILPATVVAQRRSIDVTDLHGMILPAENGSIAIVGTPGEDLEPVARRILSHLGQVS